MTHSVRYHKHVQTSIRLLSSQQFPHDHTKATQKVKSKNCHALQPFYCRLVHNKGHTHCEKQLHVYITVYTHPHTHLHTSDFLEKSWDLITSGAIHGKVPAPLMCVVCSISLASPKSVIFMTLPCRLSGDTSYVRRTVDRWEWLAVENVVCVCVCVVCVCVCL